MSSSRLVAILSAMAGCRARFDGDLRAAEAVVAVLRGDGLRRRVLVTIAKSEMSNRAHQGALPKRKQYCIQYEKAT
jgi:hypothetical protein